MAPNANERLILGPKIELGSGPGACACLTLSRFGARLDRTIVSLQCQAKGFRVENQGES
jgi:hypothetical protein